MGSVVTTGPKAGKARTSARQRSTGRPGLEAVRDRRGEHVATVQSTRLVAGAVRAVDRYGYAQTTVSEITALAHVSRRTFYELFADSEACMLAMYEEILGRARAQVGAAGLDRLGWRERVRGGLWAILCFLDAEPVLARVGLVQSAKGGPRIVELRERMFAELAGVLDEGREAGSRGADCPELTAEGLVGAVASILHTRLVRGTLEGTSEHRPLKDLQGELMAMILAPYLGPAAARAERKRAMPEPPATPVTDFGPSASLANGAMVSAERDPLHGLSMRFTYRTACVLEAVAAAPGLSNRGVGNAAGIPDQGQVSKLLARLEKLGLLRNTAPLRRGAANAWELTAEGEQIVRVVGVGAVAGVGA